jgi:hypothetical protein
MYLPDDFADHLSIDNAAERFTEAVELRARIVAAGVPLLDAPDHAAIFCDPPQLVMGPLAAIGYDFGWDTRCYPSWVDERLYINVPGRLREDSEAYSRGWFRHVAAVFPIDAAARDNMDANPFLHHVTWGIAPPVGVGITTVEDARALVTHMAHARTDIRSAIGEDPGTLIIAMPEHLARSDAVRDGLPGWVGDATAAEYVVQEMQGGGFLIQFFVLTGGRIEIALRLGTTQTFNPANVDKISRDEISTSQADA